MKQQNVKLFATAMIPAAAAATLCCDARAALLTAGGTAQDFFSSLAERPDLAGSVVAAELIPVRLRGDDGSAVHSLSIFSQVIRHPGDNTLSFSYRVINDDDGARTIVGLDRFDTSSFAGFGADVASILDGAGQTSPTIALRSNEGSQITFDFDDSASRIAAGASSFDFLIKTDATEYNHAGNIELLAFTSVGLDEGSDPIAFGAARATGFQPTTPGAAVPLPPATMAMVPTTIAVTIYTLRRQRRQKHASK